MKNNIFDSRQRPKSIYSTNNSSINDTITIWSSISYQVVQNFRCVHHRLVPRKCFERHCHRSKLNPWYWRNGYIPDTGKVSGFWMSFVPWTHFYRQKIKYTKLAAKLVPTTTCQRVELCKTRFWSLRSQTEPFFTTCVKNRTLPIIWEFLWNRSDTNHFLCIPLWIMIWNEGTSGSDLKL